MIMYFCFFISVLYSACAYSSTPAYVPVDSELELKWPSKTPKCISDAVKINKEDFLKYKTLGDQEKENFSKKLLDDERKLYLSSSTKLTTKEIRDIVVDVANLGLSGYLPATFRLSEFFMEGIYKIPKDNHFAIELLKLIPLDDCSIEMFDEYSLRIILKEIYSKKLANQTEIADSFDVSQPTVSRFLSGLNSPKILKNFKDKYKNQKISDLVSKFYQDEQSHKRKWFFGIFSKHKRTTS